MTSALLALALGLAAASGDAGAGLAELGRIEPPAGIEVRFVRVFPDGQQLVAACADGTLRFWPLPAGSAPGAAPTRTVEIDGQRISAMELSADGAWLAAGTTAGTVAVMAAHGEGAVKRIATGGRRVDLLALAPGGQVVALAAPSSPPELWDVAAGTRRAVLATPVGGANALAFSPDGSLVASASEDAFVRFYDRDGKSRAVADASPLESFGLGFIAGGRQVAVAGADKTVTLIDAATGTVARRLPRQEDPIVFLVALRDGRTLVTVSFKEGSMQVPGPLLAWPLDGAPPRVLATGRVFNGGGALADGGLIVTAKEGRSIVVFAGRPPEPRATIPP